MASFLAGESSGWNAE
ncbi:unnamed protein product, partial [Cuscuta epithymum]